MKEPCPCNVTLMVYHHQHRQNKVENGLSDGMVKMQIEIGFGLRKRVGPNSGFGS